MRNHPRSRGPWVEVDGRLYYGRAPSPLTVASAASASLGMVESQPCAAATSTQPASAAKRKRDTPPSEPAVTSLKYGWGLVMKDNIQLKEFVSRLVAYMAQYEHWASLAFVRALWDAAKQDEPVNLDKPSTLLAMLRLPWAREPSVSWMARAHEWLHAEREVGGVGDLLPPAFRGMPGDPGINHIRSTFHKHYYGLWKTYNQDFTLAMHIRQALRRLFPSWRAGTTRMVAHQAAEGKLSLEASATANVNTPGPFMDSQARTVEEAKVQLQRCAPLVLCFKQWQDAVRSTVVGSQQHRTWHALRLRVGLLSAMEAAAEASPADARLRGKLFTLAPVITTARPFVRLNNSWVRYDLLPHKSQVGQKLGVTRAESRYGVLGLMKLQSAPERQQPTWATDQGGSKAMLPVDRVPSVWRPGWRLPRSIQTDGVSVVISWQHSRPKPDRVKFLAQADQASLAVKPDDVASLAGHASRKASAMAKAVALAHDAPDGKVAMVQQLASIASRQLPVGIAALAACDAVSVGHGWSSVPYSGSKAWLNLGKRVPASGAEVGEQQAARAFCCRKSRRPESPDPPWLTKKLWLHVLRAAQAVQLQQPACTQWLEVSCSGEAASASQVLQGPGSLATQQLYTRLQLVSSVQADGASCCPYVVAADPGEVHLVAAVDGDGTPTFKYSKAQYYHDIGAAQMRMKSPRLYDGLPWRERVARGWTPAAVVQAQAEMSAHSLAAACLAQFMTAVRHQAAHRDVLREFYGRKWLARCRFHRFQRKQRTLQHVVDRLAPRHPVTGERPLLLMGAGYAGRRQAYRGSALGPSGLMGVMEYVRKHVQVAYIDEYFTSQKCCECHSTMEKLRALRRGRDTRELRLRQTAGKYCTTCKRAVARDTNAARNILKAGIAEYWGHSRPEYLRRTATA